MTDGRPCNTDMFLDKLVHNHDVDHYDIKDAVKAWVYGYWKEAFAYLSLDDIEELEKQND
mgnify:CR=1 FL=1